MPPFIHLLIVGNMSFTVLLGGDNSRSPAALKFGPQMIGVKSLIRQQGPEGQAVNQVWYANNLAALPGMQTETHEIAKSVNQSQNLGGQSPFGTSDGLIESPPLAPVAFW